MGNVKSRRRLFGNSQNKVADLVFSPTGGDYSSQLERGLGITISTPTEGAKITYWATRGGNPYISQTTVNSNTVTFTVTCTSRQAYVKVFAYASKPFWKNSNQRSETYYNTSTPDAPLISLYASDDGYGNHWDQIYEGRTPYTPARFKIVNPSPDNSSQICYSVSYDGREPVDPSAGVSGVTVCGAGISEVYVNWPAAVSDTQDHSIIVVGESRDPYWVKAAILTDTIYSKTAESSASIGQSTNMVVSVYHTDEDTLGTVGKYDAVEDNRTMLDVDEDLYSGSQYVIPAHYDSLSPGKSYIDVNNIPNKYGFGICTPADDGNASSEVYVSTDDGTTSKKVEKNNFYSNYSNLQLKWTVKKLGCRDIDNFSSTTEHGDSGIGKMLYINRFVCKYTTTAQNNTIIIGRKYVWRDSGLSYGNNFGEFPLIASHTGPVQAESIPIEFDYDVRDAVSDNGPCVRVYADGVRLTSSDFREVTYNVYKPSCPIYVDNSSTGGVGKYMKQGEFQTYQETQTVYTWTPSKAGTHILIYSYPEKYRKYRSVTIGSLPQTDIVYGYITSPIGFLSSTFHQGMIGTFSVCPSDVTISSGMTIIPRFFFSNIRPSMNTDQKFHFSTDTNNTIYSLKLVRNDGNSLTQIHDYAFSGTKPRNGYYDGTNNPVVFNLSTQTYLREIHNYVFFDCVMTLGWDDPKPCINSISLPASVNKIGWLFDGFNCHVSYLSNGAEPSSAVVDFVFGREIPPDIGAFDPVCSTSSWSSQTSYNEFPYPHPQVRNDDDEDTYITGSGAGWWGTPVDSKEWRTMAFCYVAWGGTVANPESFGYLNRLNQSSRILVKDPYVCVYTEKWKYQLGRSPETPSELPSVFIPIVGMTDGRDHTYHDNITWPAGSSSTVQAVQGRFTCSDEDVRQEFGTKKLCFACANLRFTGSGSNYSNGFYIGTDQFQVFPDPYNTSTSPSGQRDMFAFATSNINHNVNQDDPYWSPWGDNGYHQTPHYHPYEFCDDSKNHLAYGWSKWSFWTSHRMNINYAVPSDWEADWCYNIKHTNNDSDRGKWHTFTSQEIETILFYRKTLYGYRFVRAEVNGQNGIIILPDNWMGSLYNLKKVNVTDSMFIKNTISLSDWNSIFEPNGAVFLQSNGILRLADGGPAVQDKNSGYYWTSDHCDDNEILGSLNRSDAYALVFQPAGGGNIALGSSGIPKDRGLNVRPTAYVRYQEIIDDQA